MTGSSSERSSAPDAWAQFAQARSVDAFCQAWLAILVETVGRVRRGLVLFRGDDGSYTPAAFWPGADTDLTDLAEPARRCLAQRKALVEPLGRPEAPDPAGAEAAPVAVAAVPGGATVTPLPAGKLGVVLAYPVELRGAVVAAIVLDLVPRTEPLMQHAFRALHWGVGWLDALLRGQEVERLGADGRRAQQVVDALLRVAEAAGLDEAAHGVVDRLAEQLQLERAALGLLQRGRSARVVLRALSSVAWFDRRSELVRRIENAMEEAWDQRLTVALPPLPGLPETLAVAHADLAGEGPAASSVVSVVVAARGEALGVLTVERSGARPFGADELRWLEAWARSVGPVLALHAEGDRWLAGRLRRRLDAARAAFTDPRRPSWRLGAAAVALVALALAFVDADHKVSAEAALEGVVQRQQVAPFDGFVREAPVKAGQTVKAGDVLARLDDRDLRLEQERWRSAAAQHDRRYRDALARHERAAARIAAAERAEAEAQLALVDEQLAKAELTAPFDGVVVSGDLSQLLGSPVEKGKLLFEVAPLDAFRVVLKVPDTDIRSVAAGQRGQLVLAGLTGEKLGFTVRNIAVAGAHDGRNVFEVEAVLDRAPPQLRPGMEGVGKIEAGERRLLWIWTHRFTDWLRLKLWQWAP